MDRPSDQHFELDRLKTLCIVLIAILTISTGSLYLQTQTLQEENVDTLREVNSLNDTVHDQRNIIQEQNETIAFERQRNHDIKMENGQLRELASRAMVEVDFITRNGDTVDIDFNNYGNTTAENIEATCQVYREGSDGSYDSFTASVNSLENRTTRTVSAIPTISEEVRSTDQVSCEVTSCQGNCKLLQQNIDRPYSEHLRQDFN